MTPHQARVAAGDHWESGNGLMAPGHDAVIVCCHDIINFTQEPEKAEAVLAKMEAASVWPVSLLSTTVIPSAVTIHEEWVMA